MNLSKVLVMVGILSLAFALPTARAARVPDVIGLTQSDAEEAIEDARLRVGTVSTANSVTQPAGIVIDQDPTARTRVLSRSFVDLVVSLGAEVPDVVGMPQATAQTALTKAGLTLGTVTSAGSATVLIGSVISQTPAPGNHVAPGSAVALVISLGAEVPNVVGSTQAAAQTALTAAGLTVGTVTTANSTTVPIDTVISQTPGPGNHLSPGSTVKLVLSSGPPTFLMGVQNDPNTGPLVNSLYRILTDGVVTKIGDLDHRTHGLAFVGSTLYSLEEQTLGTLGTPPKLYKVNVQSGATLTSVPLSLSTGEALRGGVGLATQPGTNQLWALLVVSSEENTFRRLVTIDPITGLATQIAKLSGRFMDMMFDTGGTLYAIADNRPVPGGSPILPARIYSVDQTTGSSTEFLDVSGGAVAGLPDFRESETIGGGLSSNRLYHLSGQHKVTACCTKNILFEWIHLTTKVRTAIPITGPDFFVTTALTLLPPDSARTLGDLDASGTADLVWRHTVDGNTAIWLMDGTVIVASGFPAGLPMAWQIAGVGDVNGDGKGDVIWRDSTNGTVAIWIMDGLTITSVGFPAGTSTDWMIEKIGDVDGNGTADLVWRNTDGVVAIWWMNGSAITTTGILGGVPAEWQIEGLGDVNGDGRTDVIWHNTITGTVAVWLMNGMSIASVGFPAGTSTDWKLEGVGDTNADGKADLIWRNETSQAVVIWLMNGAVLTTSGEVGNLSSDWKLEQVGDINGDRKADLVLHHQTTGEVSVWLLDGLAVIGSGSPETVSPDWEIQP